MRKITLIIFILMVSYIIAEGQVMIEWLSLADSSLPLWGMTSRKLSEVNMIVLQMGEN